MHIVVLTRSVPDTAALPTVDAAGGVTATWDIPEPVINPWDEYAVEEAVLLKEAHGGVVTALAVGPDDDGIALRYAVSMGCDTALRVWDAGLAGADAFGLARAAAAAVRRLGGVDLVLAGKEAVDLNTGAVHLGVARALGWPALTLVDDIVGVDFGAGKITVVRALEQGRQTIRAPLPAVVSVVKAINEPRYPTFAGMRKAKKLVIPVRTPGVAVAASKVRQVALDAAPARAGAAEIVEAGTAQEAASILVDKLIAEKVI